MKRAYEMLLGLYPADYRAFFAAAMLNAFEKALEERRRDRQVVLARFVFAELKGIAIGAGAEWISKLTSEKSIRGRCLPDVRMMRPPGVTREDWFLGGRRGECSSDISR